MRHIILILLMLNWGTFYNELIEDCYTGYVSCRHLMSNGTGKYDLDEILQCRDEFHQCTENTDKELYDSLMEEEQ